MPDVLGPASGIATCYIAVAAAVCAVRLTRNIHTAEIAESAEYYLERNYARIPTRLVLTVCLSFP